MVLKMFSASVGHINNSKLIIGTYYNFSDCCTKKTSVKINNCLINKYHVDSKKIIVKVQKQLAINN